MKNFKEENFKIDVDSCLPHENYCCFLKIRFIELLLRFCRFVKMNTNIICNS